MRAKRDHETMRLVPSRIGFREMEFEDRDRRKHLIVCLSEDSLDSSKMWFDDKSLFTKQSEYLTKLRDLRSQLIDQETENLSNALTRFQTKDEKSPRPKIVYPPKRHSRDPVKDAQSIVGMATVAVESPRRHQELMEEKRLRLKRLRRKPDKPELEVVTGKRVTGLNTPEYRYSPSTDSESSILKKLSREKDSTPIIRRTRNRKPPLLSVDPQTSFPNGETVVKTLLHDSNHDRWKTRQPRPRAVNLVHGYRDEITITSSYMRYIWKKQENALKEATQAPAPTPLPQDFTLKPLSSPKIVEAKLSSPKPVTHPPPPTPSNDSIHLPSIDDRLINADDSPPTPENKKCFLVVEMPQISCVPATPDPDRSDSAALDSWKPSRSLMRVMQKHSLREREIKNLLQDVRDLNEINANV